MTQTKGKGFSIVITPCFHSSSRRYETISDLMGLQDQIESFEKMVFSHFRHSANNECRISALVPLVKESWGIYRFITSMLRAMHRSKLMFHNLVRSNETIIDRNE
jgi:hypothetical protein